MNDEWTKLFEDRVRRVRAAHNEALKIENVGTSSRHTEAEVVDFHVRAGMARERLRFQQDQLAKLGDTYRNSLILADPA